jgi:hypothetical protein
MGEAAEADCVMLVAITVNPPVTNADIIFKSFFVKICCKWT